MQFPIKVQYSTSLTSPTCMLFNALHLYSVSLTSPTSDQIQCILFMFFIFVDRQCSAETENKRRILRPIYKAVKKHPSYRGRCKMENQYLKVHGKQYGVNNINNLPDELGRFKCTSKETPTELGFFGELNPLSNFYNCEFTKQSPLP